MGEAKRRKAMSPPMAYHHTSILRTAEIWTSGVVQVEGEGEPAFHPQLGEIKTNVLARRDLKDFPPLAWFTTQISIPNCLITESLLFVNKETGEEQVMQLSDEISHGIALNRIALGFPVSDIPVVSWPEHFGYTTQEGIELNASAREYGDNPEDWYVSEQPVDVLKATEVWTSKSVVKPKLKRQEQYLADVHKMVCMCRDNPGTRIAPTWLSEERVKELVHKVGGKLHEKDGEPSILTLD